MPCRGLNRLAMWVSIADRKLLPLPRGPCQRASDGRSNTWRANSVERGRVPAADRPSRDLDPGKVMDPLPQLTMGRGPDLPDQINRVDSRREGHQ